MKKLIACLAFAAAAAAPVSAQSCSTLSVTGSGAPGTVLTFALTGADDNAFAMVVFGENTGSTTLSFGRSTTLDLGLDYPFFPLPLGLTDGNGDASVDVTVPAAVIPAALNAQGFSVGFGITPGTGVTIDFCVSDVVPFTVG